MQNPQYDAAEAAVQIRAAVLEANAAYGDDEAERQVDVYYAEAPRWAVAVHRIARFTVRCAIGAFALYGVLGVLVAVTR